MIELKGGGEGVLVVVTLNLKYSPEYIFPVLLFSNVGRLIMVTIAIDIYGFLIFKK